jgi:hypothetical protein
MGLGSKFMSMSSGGNRLDPPMPPKPPDCTCRFPLVIARNMCGHTDPCPVYRRFIGDMDRGKGESSGQTESLHPQPISMADIFLVGVGECTGECWGVHGLFDDEAHAIRACVGPEYWYAPVTRNLFHAEPLRPNPGHLSPQGGVMTKPGNRKYPWKDRCDVVG